jgi:hypothetical protein
MKTITVSSHARTLITLLKQALEENLILKTEDGHEFLLAEIDNFDREIELTRQNEELMGLLDQRGQEEATVSPQEARARLGLEEQSST